MATVAKAKFKYVIFWLKSSRGTNTKHCRKYRGDVTRSQILDDLEHWQEGVTSGSAIEHYRYGFRIVTIKPRRELLAEWHRVCKLREKINERWEIIREKLNTIDWSKRR